MAGVVAHRRDDALGNGSWPIYTEGVADGHHLVARVQARGLSEGKGVKSAAAYTHHRQIADGVYSPDRAVVDRRVVYGDADLPVPLHHVVVGDDVSGLASGFEYDPGAGA